MPSATIRRALINPETFTVQNITNIAATYTQWTDNGIVCWVAVIGSNQNPSIGDIYTPINSPITNANALDGGTYAAAPPVYPPIADSKIAAINAVIAIADQQIVAAVGASSVSDAFIASNKFVDLSTRAAKHAADPIVYPDLSIQDKDDFALLQLDNDAAAAIVGSQNQIIAWIQDQTDPALMAGFDASDPAASGAPGWPY